MPQVSFEALSKQIVQESIQDAKGKIPPDVCAAWKSAEPVLEKIRDAVKNPWVKLAIDIVIAIGNGLCPAR